MSIPQQQYERILHDFKKIGKVVQIITNEPELENRKVIADLLRDLLDEIYGEIAKIKGE